MKKKVLGAYDKRYKQRCHKHGKCVHKPGDYKCSENKKEDKKDAKTEKNEDKKIFDGVWDHHNKKGNMNRDFKENIK